MAIFYVMEQGAALVKSGERLVVEKKGQPIHWVHAFKVDQVVVMGNVHLTPGVIAFLLQQGIDTVFLSYYGKYRGRLVSQFGKNVQLRQLQFQKMGEPAFRLSMATAYVVGKLNNCRILLRRQNQEVKDPEITRVIDRLRILARQAPQCDSVESLMGIEGAGAAAYFGCFGRLIRVDDITFDGRNRRPPRDPVNVLLSLGYTLLANAVQTQVHIAGLDPFVGCLHGVEYGRPSLVLDLMEEFRPVLVDAAVISAINRREIKALDFFRPEDREPPAFDFAETEPAYKDYPILLGHRGMKKFVTGFEQRLNQRVLYLPTGQRLTYRQVILEQVRLLVRTLSGEAGYGSFSMR
ncbi:MAG: CRISPR-associated endonuclease Cas1 [Thermodesulfobacteriota bacterium]